MKHRIAIISPDKHSDYCYLDMSAEEAMKRFKEHEDWANIYEPRGLEPKVVEHEFDDSFMLWRGIGNDIAKLARERGMPPELVNLFGNPDE